MLPQRESSLFDKNIKKKLQFGAFLVLQWQWQFSVSILHKTQTEKSD